MSHPELWRTITCDVFRIMRFESAVVCNWLADNSDIGSYIHHLNLQCRSDSFFNNTKACQDITILEQKLIAAALVKNQHSFRKIPINITGITFGQYGATISTAKILSVYPNLTSFTYISGFSMNVIVGDLSLFDLHTIVVNLELEAQLINARCDDTVMEATNDSCPMLEIFVYNYLGTGTLLVDEQLLKENNKSSGLRVLHASRKRHRCVSFMPLVTRIGTCWNISPSSSRKSTINIIASQTLYLQSTSPSLEEDKQDNNLDEGVRMDREIDLLRLFTKHDRSSDCPPEHVEIHGSNDLPYEVLYALASIPKLKKIVLRSCKNRRGYTFPETGLDYFLDKINPDTIEYVEFNDMAVVQDSTIAKLLKLSRLKTITLTKLRSISDLAVWLTIFLITIIMEMILP
ncbi:hypothetical protein BDA99DRAFT_533111 [Phascolomyces articulosus]|uniref:Uncharacterized protein n=1 Tax=Phascolomyces articulosus TaxID=60185 RepID=A0AAD5K8D1_9FUNG|nr:hypothetical protein BDA99DRAFT_533111 [Phascolomyces articulosus]